MRSVEGEVVCGSIFRNDCQGAAREATFVADVSQGQVTPLEAHTETMRMRRDGDSIPNGEAIWVDLLGCEGTQAFIGLGTWHRATRLLDIQKEYTQMGFQKEYPGDLHCELLWTFQGGCLERPVVKSFPWDEWIICLPSG